MEADGAVLSLAMCYPASWSLPLAVLEGTTAGRLPGMRAVAGGRHAAGATGDVTHLAPRLLLSSQTRALGQTTSKQSSSPIAWNSSTQTP